jgi:ATP-dependent DNA helicase PIF1
MHSLQGRGRSVVAAAFTGIAASLLHGGTTIHSRFKLPIEIGPESTCRLAFRDKLTLQQTSAIIIDEAPMCSIDMIDCLDRELRDICKSPNLLFGGKTVILGGDFRQTLPIAKHSTPAMLTSKCLKKWSKWRFVKKRKLTKNMRTGPDEIQFAEYLIKLGNGELENLGINLIRVPDQTLCQSEDELIDFVYGTARPIPLESLTDNIKAIIAPLNEDVKKANEKILALLPGYLSNHIFKYYMFILIITL